MCPTKHARSATEPKTPSLPTLQEASRLLRAALVAIRFARLSISSVYTPEGMDRTPPAWWMVQAESLVQEVATVLNRDLREGSLRGGSPKKGDKPAQKLPPDVDPRTTA